jgi:hypothetical protein
MFVKTKLAEAEGIREQDLCHHRSLQNTNIKVALKHSPVPILRSLARCKRSWAELKRISMIVMQSASKLAFAHYIAANVQIFNEALVVETVHALHQKCRHVRVLRTCLLPMGVVPAKVGSATSPTVAPASPKAIASRS